MVPKDSWVTLTEGIWPQAIAHRRKLKSGREDNESNFRNVKFELLMGCIGNHVQKVVGFMKH